MAIGKRGQDEKKDKSNGASMKWKNAGAKPTFRGERPPKSIWLSRAAGFIPLTPGMQYTKY